MPPRKNPTVRQKRLGAELRRLREGAGLSIEDAADLLDCGKAKISRIETGVSGVRSVELRHLLREYGNAGQSLTAALLELAREGRRRGWWNTYRDVLDPKLADLADAESRAVGLHSWETIVIPGLLQTPDYMRALFRRGRLDVPEAEIGTHVEARVQRQHILRGEERPEVWAVLYEPVLHACFGEPSVMREQFGHLTVVAQQPHVTVQVLPYRAGAHRGVNGPFLIVDTGSPGMDVVLLDSMVVPLYLEEESHLRGYRLVFDQLRAAALGPVPSLEFIERAAHRLQS